MNRAKSAAAAISYALGPNRMKEDTKEWLIEHGCPPDALKGNDRAVVRSGINISPIYANAEMKAVRQHANGDTVKNQAVRIIQSFSADDLDITSPENWQICNEIGYEFARRAFGGLDDEGEEGYYPPYQIAIYTHVDGKGHKLHNHIIINKTNLNDGKQWTVDNLDQEWRSFREINDAVCREYGLKITQERSKKVKKTISERELELKGQYVWKNDLRTRIDEALAEIKKKNINLEDALKTRGVDVRRRGQNGISYAFIDEEGKKRISRGKRLGTNYERESIDEHEQEIKQQREQQERAREAARSVRLDAKRQAIAAVQKHQQRQNSMIRKYTAKKLGSCCWRRRILIVLKTYCTTMILLLCPSPERSQKQKRSLLALIKLKKRPANKQPKKIQPTWRECGKMMQQPMTNG